MKPQPLPLIKLIPKLSPQYIAPNHLQPLIARLERALHEPLRIVSSVPPRHSKTETLLHFIVWLLLIDPSLEIMFLSYAQRISERKSRRARELAKRAGIQLATDSQSKSDWRTVEGGGLWASSPGGSNTGEGARVIIVDDPIRGRADAESAVERDKLFDAFLTDIFTRAEPSASLIVNHTRFHVDDLGGRLIGRGWEHINLPALTEAGEALWPERWPAEEIKKIQTTIGEYAFSGLYQGAPRPRGGELFKGTNFFSSLPEGVRFGIGIDLAYSQKTHADYSVAVVLAKHRDTFYVVDVVRAHTSAPTFARTVKSLSDKYGGAPVHWYTSSTEIGMAQMMREASGIPIHGEVAGVDKFMRAQRAAAAWNAGKVLLPREAMWLEDFVSELLDFTGVADRHDDQVDALASAHRALFREKRKPHPLPTLDIKGPGVFDDGFSFSNFYGDNGFGGFAPGMAMSQQLATQIIEPVPNLSPIPREPLPPIHNEQSLETSLPSVAADLARDYFKP